MTRKIKLATIERKVRLLNDLTGNPVKPWYELRRGQYVAQVGCYHLKRVGGGMVLKRIIDDQGKAEGVFSLMETPRPKETLWLMIEAYMNGYEAGKAAGVSDD